MKRLLMLSGKGGTGKTTVSAAFMKLSNAKAICDCDVDAPNLHLVIDREDEPVLSDFFGGDKAVIDIAKCVGCGICQSKCRFDAITLKNYKAIINDFSCEGCGVCVYVCSSKAVSLKEDIAGEQKVYLGDKVFSTATLKMGRGNSGKLVADVKNAMTKNAPDCNIAIIDGSPGIGCPVIASVSGVDLVLIVAEPSESGISDLLRLVNTVASFQTDIAICVNKYDTSLENTNKIEDFCKEKGISFVGKIPFDKEAVKAVNYGYTIVDIDCPSGIAVKKIYEEINLKLI